SSRCGGRSSSRRLSSSRSSRSPQPVSVSSVLRAGSDGSADGSSGGMTSSMPAVANWTGTADESARPGRTLLSYCYLAVQKHAGWEGPPMSHPAVQDGDRHAWATQGIEDLGNGVHRIPLPLPMAGLKAVNVYALVDDHGVDLIDAGMALGYARDRLTAALKELDREPGDVANYFITHAHRDHYTLAVELRRSGYGSIALGAGEQANLVAARELGHGDAGGFLADLQRMGALELAAKLSAGRDKGERPPGADEWEDPDRWLDDGTELDVRSMKLRAIHTPGHTRGHLVFHDAAASLLFAGDHVLPHITPTIGFEPARNR